MYSDICVQQITQLIVVYIVVLGAEQTIVICVTITVVLQIAQKYDHKKCVMRIIDIGSTKNKIAHQEKVHCYRNFAQCD